MERWKGGVVAAVWTLVGAVLAVAVLFASLLKDEELIDEDRRAVGAADEPERA